MLTTILFMSTQAIALPPAPIVGGDETSDFIQVGAIVADSEWYSTSFCSGTLIHPSWVLTAAHCLVEQDAAEDLQNQGFDIMFVSTNDVENDSWEHFAEVEEMIPHPGYSSSYMSNDIALLKLATEINTSGTMPIWMDSPDDDWDDITYVGFGMTSDSNYYSSGVRRTVDVPYYTATEQHIYTFDSSGDTNVCSGDSGGAALIETEDGGYALVGVNSFIFDVYGNQPHCEGVGAAGASTRVDEQLAWVLGYLDLPEEHEPTEGENAPNDNGLAEGDSIEGWLPPFPDNEYKEQDSPKAAGCSSVATAQLSAWFLFGLALLRRRSS